MNCIQYASEAFSDKNEVKKYLWPRANKGSTPVYFVEDPPLQTLVDMLESGHAVKRGGTHTSFAWVDYDNADNADIHIDTIRAELRGYPNIAVVGSASGSPYRCHIIQHLPYEIPLDCLQEECTRLKSLVKRHIPAMRTFDDCTDLPDQALYGTPTCHRGRTVYPGSIRISRIARRDENPMDLLCPDDAALYLPLNSSSLARMRGVTWLEENGYRFDVVVPSMVPRFKKIDIGHRYSWSMNLAMRLLMRCFHLNENCNYHVSKSDYLRTLVYLILSNVVSPWEFREEEIPAIYNLAARSWDRWAHVPFQRKVSEFSKYFSQAEMPKRPYTSVRHAYELAQALIKDWTDAGMVHGKLVRLPHRRYLEDIASTYGTTYVTLQKAARSLGYEIMWKQVPVEDLPFHPDGYVVVKRGKASDTLIKYLKRHGVPYRAVKAAEYGHALETLSTCLEKMQETGLNFFTNNSDKNNEIIDKIRTYLCNPIKYPSPLLIGSHKNVRKPIKTVQKRQKSGVNENAVLSELIVENRTKPGKTARKKIGQNVRKNVRISAGIPEGAEGGTEQVGKVPRERIHTVPRGMRGNKRTLRSCSREASDEKRMRRVGKALSEGRKVSEADRRFYRRHGGEIKAVRGRRRKGTV